MKSDPTQSEPVLQGEKPRSGWQEILSTLSILGIALLTALFIIAFVFRSYQVDGPSMETTLQNGDKLIIWKVARSWARVTGHDYIPKRGDIVVFDHSTVESGSGKKQLIKRVIGLPGERVVINEGKITIYNKDSLGGFNPDDSLPPVQPIPVGSDRKDVSLDEDEIYVLGDNRPDSLDSRAFGPITADQIVGKLVLRVLPLSNAKVF